MRLNALICCDRKIDNMTTFFPYFKKAEQSLFKERKIDAYVADVVFIFI